MCAWRLPALLLCAGCSLGAVVSLRADETGIAQRRRTQQATVEIARGLIGQVLDVQLLQFSENGLQSLPVFTDIRDMRSNLDQVADKDMRNVIDLLTKAQLAVDADRSDYLERARGEARNVAAVLMSERERLRKRLQVAHLHAQLRQLIGKQSAVRETTRTLQEIPRQQRDMATLEALEDQRDTRTLFQQSLESMEAVQLWDTTEGKTAAESLQALREEQTERLFDHAESNLAQGQLDVAERDQTEIVRRLSQVLEKMEQARGIRQAGPERALEEVEQLLAAQRALTDETSQVEESERDLFDGLSDRQRDIRQQTAQLEELVAGEQEEGLVKQANAAAHDAETALFEAKKQTAIQHQQRVTQNLDELRTLLNSRHEQSAADPGQAAAAALTEQLEQLEAALGKLEEKQADVLHDIESVPERAQERQEEVARALKGEVTRQPLPDAVRDRVEAAAAKADGAAEVMQDATQDTAAARATAAREVQQALRAARAEAASQLLASRNAASGRGQQASVPESQQGSTATPSRQSAGNQEGGAAEESAESRSRSPGKSQNQSASERVDSDATMSQRRVADGQRATEDRDGVQGRSITDSPWFAKLPPEVREAIRVRSRRRPPRGYEDKLRRYFKSVDR